MIPKNPYQIINKLRKKILIKKTHLIYHSKLSLSNYKQTSLKKIPRKKNAPDTLNQGCKMEKLRKSSSISSSQMQTYVFFPIWDTNI